MKTELKMDSNLSLEQKNKRRRSSNFNDRILLTTYYDLNLNNNPRYKGRNLLDSLKQKISGHAKSLESNIKERMTLYKLNSFLRNVDNYWKNIIIMGHRV